MLAVRLKHNKPSRISELTHRSFFSWRRISLFLYLFMDFCFVYWMDSDEDICHVSIMYRGIFIEGAQMLSYLTRILIPSATTTSAPQAVLPCCRA